MAEEYVVLSDPAFVGGVEYDAGAIVAIDDTISDEFGTPLTQDHVGWTAAEWTVGNPTMSANHFGVESDTGLSKLGDGSTDWNTLDYAPTTFTPDTMADLSSDFSRYAGVTPATGDSIVVNDVSDSGNPKLVLLSDLKTLMNS